MSELTLLRGGAALGAAGTLLGALATSAGLALTGILLAGAGISICAPVLFSIAGRSADEAVRGAAVSIVTTIAYLGFLVGPAAVGPAGQRHRPADEPRVGGRCGGGAGDPGARGGPGRGLESPGRQPPDRCGGGRLTDQGARNDPFGAVGHRGGARPPPRSDGAGAMGRFAAPERRLGFWLALWAAVIAAEFGALVPVIFPGEEPVPAVQVVYRLVGGSFAACGLIAWRRRPDSRSGALMTATGFGFFVSPLLNQLHAAVAQTAARC